MTSCGTPSSTCSPTGCSRPGGPARRRPRRPRSSDRSFSHQGGPILKMTAMKKDIHPTAIIEAGAKLGAGCVIHAGAIIKAGAVLGDRVAVHPYAVVGGDPQVLKFDPATPTGVKVGDG